MRVKKYRTNNLPEAMRLIRADLGPDALIIDSQKVLPGGWLGWLRQPILEVTAAVDTICVTFRNRPRRPLKPFNTCKTNWLLSS
jgi:flagellar biosynthesis protein FlhF